MAVRKRYVKKHAVGGSGILDFVKSEGRKVVNLFTRAKPVLSKIANSGVGKALVSAGNDLAVAGIGAAQDYAVNKIAERAQAAKVASAINAANSDNVDEEYLRRVASITQPTSNAQPTTTSITRPTHHAPKPVAHTLSEALGTNYSRLLDVPSGGSIKVHEYAKKIRGSGLRKVY